MDLEQNGIWVWYCRLFLDERAAANESCRVALGPQARDAVVLLAVLQVLCGDAAN